jgi:hypothetical protein
MLIKWPSQMSNEIAKARSTRETAAVTSDGAAGAASSIVELMNPRTSRRLFTKPKFAAEGTLHTRSWRELYGHTSGRTTLPTIVHWRENKPRVKLTVYVRTRADPQRLRGALRCARTERAKAD